MMRMMIDSKCRQQQQQHLPHVQLQQEVRPPMSLEQASRVPSVTTITSLPGDSVGAYVPRPISHHSLDAHITLDEDSMQVLTDDLIELYNSLPDDTESQHNGQQYSNLLDKVTGGSQSKGDRH